MHKNPSMGQRPTCRFRENFVIFMHQLLWEDDKFGECQLELTPFPKEMYLHISLGNMPTGPLGRWILWGRHIFMQQSIQNQTSLWEDMSTLTILLPTHFPKESLFLKKSLKMDFYATPSSTENISMRGGGHTSFGSKARNAAVGVPSIYRECYYDTTVDSCSRY